MNAITIDGPAASGKSTVGYQVAQQLNFLFFDTGVMYRAVAWAILEEEIDSGDSDAVGSVAEELSIEISSPTSEQADGRQATVRSGGQDITWAIHSRRVDRIVSVVAANSRVRQELSRQQRNIGLAHGSDAGEKTGVVMVGRDIGTVVLPEAPLKIYMLAPVEERARRRFREISLRGKEADFAQILTDMRRRDEIDSQRAVAPLRPAEDAYQIQTLCSSIQQIVDQILVLAVSRLGVEPVPDGEIASSADSGSGADQA